MIYQNFYDLNRGVSTFYIHCKLLMYNTTAKIYHGCMTGMLIESQMPQKKRKENWRGVENA